MHTLLLSFLLVSPSSQQLEQLRGVVSQLLPQAETLAVDASLFEEGLDSIALMQLIVLLETEWGFRLSPDDLLPQNFETLQALLDLITKKKAQTDEGDS